MELVHAHQVTFEELLNENIDILIAVCGSETRSSHLVQHSNFNARRKIALIFDSNINSHILIQNQNIFNENGFECIQMESNSTNHIVKVLNSICNCCYCDNIKLCEFIKLCELIKLCDFV